jgi:hypothetical protein
MKNPDSTHCPPTKARADPHSRSGRRGFLRNMLYRKIGHGYSAGSTAPAASGFAVLLRPKLFLLQRTSQDAGADKERERFDEIGQA